MSATDRSRQAALMLAVALMSACTTAPVSEPARDSVAQVDGAAHLSQPSATAAADAPIDSQRFDSQLTLMAPDGYAEEFFSLIGDDRIDLDIHMLDAYSEGDYWPQATMTFHDLDRVQFLACRLTQNEAGDLVLSFARGDDESQHFEVTATEHYPVDYHWFTEITLADDHLILRSKDQDPWYLPLDFVVNEYSLRVSSARTRFEVSYPTLFDD